MSSRVAKVSPFAFLAANSVSVMAGRVISFQTQ
jgi:hypothetical protein